MFAQAETDAIPVARLEQAARRFFQAELVLLEQSGASVLVELIQPGLRGTFRLRSAPVTEDDLARARAAEQAGRAAGMAALAARCRFLWRVEPQPGAGERALLGLLALLASVALGPVLPPDATTLFGVRGALERAQKA